jgi:cardiolipin synthase
VELLNDATQNYPAWLAAIEAARQSIHFESYIIHDDATGREFARALAGRARAGVQVRVLYDWLGALGKSSRRLWRDLRAAGVEVRSFNPPAWSSPFAWLSRDHRPIPQGRHLDRSLRSFSRRRCPRPDVRSGVMAERP